MRVNPASELELHWPVVDGLAGGIRGHLRRPYGGLDFAGPGSKIVCPGNIGQIDTPYQTGTTSGLTYVVDRFKPWPYGAHITLRRGERSRLADFAADNL
jgi:hypothetical protein